MVGKREKIKGIYLYTNLINGKQYVGKSNDIYKRDNQHTYGKDIHCMVIEKAIKKYGRENFKLDILVNDDSLSNDELNTLEKYYIKKYNTFEEGYNNTLGGDGAGSGEEHILYGVERPEFSKKMSGKNHHFYGKKLSKEHKQKLKDNHADFKGKNHPFYGKKHSKETRKKLSESHKKISDDLIILLKNEGLTDTNVGFIFNMSQSAISIRCKKLREQGLLA